MLHLEVKGKEGLNQEDELTSQKGKAWEWLDTSLAWFILSAKSVEIYHLNIERWEDSG